MKGIQYWKSMEEVFWDYYNHPESKFDGDTGILERKHIRIGEIIHIGKESNKLDQLDVVGVGKDGYEYYDNGEVELSEDQEDLILSMAPKVSEEIGIPERQLYYLKDRINKGGSVKLPEKILGKIVKNTHITP